MDAKYSMAPPSHKSSGSSFHQTLSERKKDKLESMVNNRPTKEDLIQKNIMKFHDADPKLHSVMGSLRQQQKGNTLNGRLSRRRSLESLTRQGIIYDKPSVLAPGVVRTQQILRRKSQKDYLSKFLSDRPSLAELVRKKNGLIEDTMTWTHQMTTNVVPTPRNCHTMTTIGDKLYLVGGYGTDSSLCDLLVLDTNTNKWSRPVVVGNIPKERFSHTCVSVGSQLILFGGFSGDGFRLADLHVLDTKAQQTFYPKFSKPTTNTNTPMNLIGWYEPQTTGNKPSSRAALTATVIGTNIYYFGGNDGQSLFNDLYILDTEKMHWTRPKQFGKIPNPRAGHTSNVIDETKILVFGGGNDRGPMNDIHILDTETMTWKKVEVLGTPPTKRVGHTTNSIFPNQLLVFGGGYMDKAFNDLHMFDVETSSWSRPSDAGTVPSPRAGHTANTIGSKMFLFGGGNAQDTWNDLHTLDTTFLRLDFATKQARSSRDEMHETQRKRSHSEPSSPHLYGKMKARSKSCSIEPVKEDQLYQEQELILKKINQKTSHIMTMIDKVSNHIDRKHQEQQKIEKSEIQRLLQLMEKKQSAHYENLNAEMRGLRSMILTELKGLKKELCTGVIQNVPPSSTKFQLPPSCAAGTNSHQWNDLQGLHGREQKRQYMNATK